MSLLQMASCRRLSTAGSSVAGYNIIVNPTSTPGDDAKNQVPEILCKICLVDYAPRDMFKLHDCGCSFCREVSKSYVIFTYFGDLKEFDSPSLSLTRNLLL